MNTRVRITSRTAAALALLICSLRLAHFSFGGSTPTASGQTSPPTNAGVCGRTPQVRDAIVATVPDVDDCASVTVAHLAGIKPRLSLDDYGISSLRPGDFAGLRNLQALWLQENTLTELPSGLFAGLDQLQTLGLADNALRTSR